MYKENYNLPFFCLLNTTTAYTSGSFFIKWNLKLLETVLFFTFLNTVLGTEHAR